MADEQDEIVQRAREAEMELARQTVSEEDLQRAIDEAHAAIEQAAQAREEELAQAAEEIEAHNAELTAASAQPAAEFQTPESINLPDDEVEPTPVPEGQQTEPPDYVPGYLPPVVAYPDSPE